MENEIKDGGPAFPGHNPNYDGNWDKRSTVGGMSMRDYFAAKALPAVMMETQETVPASLWGWVKHELHGMGLSFLYVEYRVVDGVHETAATRAYQLADAMVAAREGKA